MHQRIRPNRFLLLAGAMFFLNLCAGPVNQLQTEYLRTARHFSGTQVALFLLLTNTWGGIGVVAAGHFSDQVSRRLVAVVGLLGLAVGNAIMFATTGVPMWLASAVGSILSAAIIPSIGTMLPELFPTLRRGTANGMLNVAAVVGSVVGLLGAGALIAPLGYGATFALLAIAPLIVAVLMRWVPETAGIDLETLNPDG